MSLNAPKRTSPRMQLRPPELTSVAVHTSADVAYWYAGGCHLLVKALLASPDCSVCQQIVNCHAQVALDYNAGLMTGRAAVTTTARLCHTNAGSVTCRLRSTTTLA